MKRLASLFFAIALMGATTPVAAAQGPYPYEEISENLVAMGLAAMDEGDYSTAARRFEQAIVANPKNIEAYLALGDAHLETGSLTLSLKYYDTALSIDPTSRKALEQQSYAYIETNSVEAAKENLKKLETICLGDPCVEAVRVGDAIDLYLSETNTESENSEENE